MRALHNNVGDLVTEALADCGPILLQFGYQGCGLASLDILVRNYVYAQVLKQGDACHTVTACCSSCGKCLNREGQDAMTIAIMLFVVVQCI